MSKPETPEEQEENLKKVRNYCTEKNILLDELYEMINNNYDDVDLKNYDLPNDIPYFMRFILFYRDVSDEGKIEFMKRFGHKYLTSKQFRMLSYGCVILFVNKEFYKIFPNTESIVYPEDGGIFFRVNSVNYFI